MPTKKAAKPEGARPASPKPAQPRKRTGGTHSRKPATKWSGAVTDKSDALDLEKAVFTSDDPGRIARSLKHSAETSRRRKAGAFRSALSMLTFYVNRAGKNLSSARRHTLARAKDRLRQLFGRRSKPSIKRVQ